MTQIMTYTHTYFLTAGESDAEGRMPLTLLTERLIEVATEHANELGIGYDDLLKLGIGWVLSRLSISMNEYPTINSTYSITTWIENINRHFSDRCFEICDGSGKVLGYARTLWAAIDFNTRRSADLSSITTDAYPIAARECPVPRQSKIPALPENCPVAEYTFKYCDIDFNRHVNTVRYIELLLNQWDMDWHDCHVASTFEIAFNSECYFGETVLLRMDDAGENVVTELCHSNGVRAVGARFVWTQAPVANAGVIEAGENGVSEDMN